jgi:hypothetical protein
MRSVQKAAFTVVFSTSVIAAAWLLVSLSLHLGLGVGLFPDDVTTLALFATPGILLLLLRTRLFD